VEYPLEKVRDELILHRSNKAGKAYRPWETLTEVVSEGAWTSALVSAMKPVKRGVLLLTSSCILGHALEFTGSTDIPGPQFQGINKR
jgi:hypothetical protein